MCNTIEQVEQWKSAFAHFAIIGEQDVKIGCAAGNIDTATADLLIVDECHRAAAPSWSAKIEQAQSARWGLSATPWSDKERDAILRRLFTDRVHVVPRDVLTRSGQLAAAKVKWIDIDAGDIEKQITLEALNLIAERTKKQPWLWRTEDSQREQTNRCKWQAAQLIGIWQNERRDYAIISEANQRLSDGNHVIVLVGSIEHGKRLVEAIPGAVACYSGMGRKARREAIEGFKSGAVRCLVATSMLDEGFDAPIADCLIVASAGKSFRKSVQSTGRVLRKFDGKDHGIIIDFKDSFNPMLARQSAKRRAIYNQLNYE